MNKQFETMLEGQRKAFEFWSKFSEQMMKGYPAPEEKPAAHSENGKDIFTEWFKEQQAFFQEAMQVKSPQEAFEKAPQQFARWLDLQRSFTEKWLAFNRDHAGGWKMPLPNFAPDLMTSPQKFLTEGIEYWKKWLGDGENILQNRVLNLMPGTMRPHYTNFLEAFNTMLRYWDPLSRLVQSGVYDPEVISKFFSRDAYRHFVDQMMGYHPVGNVSELIDNVNLWFDRSIDFMQNKWKEWNLAGEDWQAMVKTQLEQGNVPIFQTAVDITNHLRDQVMPFHNFMAQGRQTEIIKLLRDIQFTYITFLLKSTEMQSMVYEAGRFVLPDLIKDYNKNIAKESTAPDFNKFFNDYINQLEVTIIDVLGSKTYTELQNDVARAGTKLNNMTQKVMELMFVEMPFLTKSEGDDIAIELQALRTKNRRLESRLAELEQRLSASPEPVAEEAKKKVKGRSG